VKQASAAAFAILTAGQTMRIDLYQITLAGGLANFYFTTHQKSVTYNGNVYNTGLIFTRGACKQKVGLEVQKMDLTVTPQSDNATGIPLIAGLQFLAAAKAKIFDGAHVLFSKMFLSNFDDLTPGATPWVQARIDTVSVDRMSAKFSLTDDIIILNNAGPPNLVQPGCSHTLFDPGCTLNAANFVVSGVATVGSTNNGAATTLTQPDDYFTLGKLTWTSGANATTPATTYFIRQYKNSFGTFIPIRPFPNVPQPGDTFIALPGCQKTIAACRNTNVAVGPAFGNLPHFNGKPFVPVPETLYDGGVPQGTSKDLGGQGGNGTTGTPFGSGVGQRGTYKP